MKYLFALACLGVARVFAAAFLLLIALMLPAMAATSVQSCIPGTQTLKTVLPALTTILYTSSAASGTPSSTLKCQALSAAPANWYVKISVDGGGTWTWEPVSTLVSALTAPPAQPPSTYPAKAVLTWVAPTNWTTGGVINQPLTYILYRGTSATNLTVLAPIAGLTYTDPAGQATPTTYYYAVTATCAACQESAESAIVSATIAAAALTPASPANLTAQ